MDDIYLAVLLQHWMISFSMQHWTLRLGVAGSAAGPSPSRINLLKNKDWMLRLGSAWFLLYPRAEGGGPVWREDDLLNERHLPVNELQFVSVFVRIVK